NSTAVACNDDFSLTTEPPPLPSIFSVPQSQMDITTAAGTTYFIMVSEEPPPFGTILTNAPGDCSNTACQPYLPATVNNAGATLLAPQFLPLSRDATLHFFAKLTGMAPMPPQLTFGSQLVGTASAGQQFTFIAANDSISNLSIAASGDFQLISTN